MSGLHRVLSGHPVNSLGEVLHPPARGLRRRLWQATSSDPAVAITSAQAAGHEGDGLQLSPATAFNRQQTSERQAEIVAAFREVHRAAHPSGTPRVQVSRAIYPHPDRAAAVAAVAPGTSLLVSFVPGVPPLDEHLRLLQAATDVAGLLGWHSQESSWRRGRWW